MEAKKKETPTRVFAVGIKLTSIGEDPCVGETFERLDAAKKSAADDLKEDGETPLVVYELVPVLVATAEQKVTFRKATGFTLEA